MKAGTPFSKVFELLKYPDLAPPSASASPPALAGPPRIRHSVCKVHVCRAVWKKIMGIGDLVAALFFCSTDNRSRKSELSLFPQIAGTGRYNRIRDAVNSGATGAPIDMRYIKRASVTTPESSSECISFLEGIYESVAETLPDIKDHSMDIALEQVSSAAGDAYSISLPSNCKPRKKQLRTAKGPRQFRKGLQVMRDRKNDVRYLPPGRMKDYYEQLLALTSATERKPTVSFATFYRDTWLLQAIGLTWKR